MIRHPLTLLLLAAVAGCSSQPKGTVLPPANLGADHFQKTAVETTKNSQSNVEFNTEKGFEEPHRSNAEFHAVYLLASLNRTNGKVGYGVDVMNATKRARKIALVNYESPEGWMEQKIRVVNGRRHCSDQDDCWNFESVSIPLSEQLVQHYAKRYVPGQSLTWKYKILPDAQGEIALAEMAGLFARVEEAKAQLAQRQGQSPAMIHPEPTP